MRGLSSSTSSFLPKLNPNGQASTTICPHWKNFLSRSVHRFSNPLLHPTRSSASEIEGIPERNHMFRSGTTGIQHHQQRSSFAK